MKSNKLDHLNCRWMAPFSRLRAHRSISERALTQTAGISRMSLRALEGRSGNPTLSSLQRAAEALDRNFIVLMTPRESELEDSTLAVSQKVIEQGFDSWKTHFFNLVDAFRRTLDPLLLLLPPAKELDPKLRALLSSIVLHLCAEARIDPPSWAQKSYFLPEPWFVSGMESLKAGALLESPLFYRRNHIFVQGNFLERA